MSSHMSLAQLRAQAKTAGLPVSGNKTALMQRLQGTSSGVPPAPTATPARKSTTATSATVRVGVQLDDKVAKAMGLRLTGVGADASGQTEYIYMRGAAAAKPASAGIAKPAKKAGTSKAGAAKGSKIGKVTDAALEEAVDSFVFRLQSKNVPVDLCRQLLGHFLDDKEVPKQKMKVYEALAEQTHYETASDDDDDE